MCRSGNVNYLGDRNNEEEQDETGSESQGTDNNFSVMAISEAFEIKQSTILSEEDLNGHIIKLKTKTEVLFAIAVSRSPMSFLNEKTARRLQENVTLKQITVILKQVTGKHGSELSMLQWRNHCPKGKADSYN